MKYTIRLLVTAMAVAVVSGCHSHVSVLRPPANLSGSANDPVVAAAVVTSAVVNAESTKKEQQKKEEQKSLNDYLDKNPR